MDAVITAERGETHDLDTTVLDLQRIPDYGDRDFHGKWHKVLSRGERRDT